MPFLNTDPYKTSTIANLSFYGFLSLGCINYRNRTAAAQVDTGQGFRCWNTLLKWQPAPSSISAGCVCALWWHLLGSRDLRTCPVWEKGLKPHTVFRLPSLLGMAGSPLPHDGVDSSLWVGSLITLLAFSTSHLPPSFASVPLPCPHVSMAPVGSSSSWSIMSQRLSSAAQVYFSLRSQVWFGSKLPVFRLL